MEKRTFGKMKEPLTKAQQIFGKDFGNATILNERPDSLRSEDPDKDKRLFREYKDKRRMQTRVIKRLFHHLN